MKIFNWNMCGPFNISTSLSLRNRPLFKGHDNLSHQGKGFVLKLYFLTFLLCAVVFPAFSQTDSTALTEQTSFGCASPSSELIQSIVGNSGDGKFQIPWEDIVYFNVVGNQNGSEQFCFYLFHVFNLINDGLKSSHPLISKGYAHLCHDSGCGNGLDTTKVTPGDLHLMLKYAGFEDTVKVESHRETAQGLQSLGAVVFLQGNLSSPGWGPSRYELFLNQGVEERDLGHRKTLQKTMDFINNHDVQEILVNLPHQFGLGHHYHYDVNVFIELGLFIREKDLDLRIVGRCGTLCANYLVPSARRVIIEPYGHIYTEGGIYGLHQEVHLVFPEQRDYLTEKFKKEWLPRLKAGVAGPDGEDPLLSEGTREADTDEDIQLGLAGFVEKYLLRFLGAMEDKDTLSAKEREQKQRKVSNFQKILKEWADLVWEDGKWEAFSKDIVKRWEIVSGRPFKDWTTGGIRQFVRGLDNEDQRYVLEDLALFIKIHIDPEVRESYYYLRDLDWLIERTLPYQMYIRDPHLSSQTDYSYSELLNVAAYLTRDYRYQKTFSVLKPYYNVPEKDKYDALMFSAELLRKVGVNVQGENHLKWLTLDWGENVLYLNEEDIDSCDFFAPQASYKEDTLKGCLSPRLKRP